MLLPFQGMELSREFAVWKERLAENITAIAQPSLGGDRLTAENARLKGQLMHFLDRLWYEACLETIRTGDVYNPGARHRVPHLFLINSHFDTELSSLDDGESFRLSDCPDDRFEILIKTPAQVVVRNIRGLISIMTPLAKVRREGNLNRTPDGNAESKVALSTFTVSHYINYRTMRRNDAHPGLYMTAFIGDEQATPHFMRYR
jgi:hypothetical protein